jgi:hypothetical protein
MTTKRGGRLALGIQLGRFRALLLETPRLTYAEIGQRLGCSGVTVAARAAELGLQRSLRRGRVPAAASQAGAGDCAHPSVRTAESGFIRPPTLAQLMARR